MVRAKRRLSVVRCSAATAVGVRSCSALPFTTPQRFDRLTGIMLDMEPNLRDRIASLKWVHTIDFGNGIVSRGQWGPPNPLIVRAFSEIDFTGKKVLDIGCWDGLWSFEAERRGAREVVATDYTSQRSFQGQPTFAVAAEALHSRAKYHPDVSVYDVKEKLQAGLDFDVVIFCGIYYHLKNPLLALARLREVMKEGGILVVEGAVINNLAETSARFFYRERLHRDASNWWLPTVACLREWVECSFFDVLKEYGPPGDLGKKPSVKRRIKALLNIKECGHITRYVLTARATCRKDPNYSFPDDDLRPFDLNEYPIEGPNWKWFKVRRLGKSLLGKAKMFGRA